MIQRVQAYFFIVLIANASIALTSSSRSRDELSRRTVLLDYSIGDSQMSTNVPHNLKDSLSVSNSIGSSVGSGAVTVELFDYECLVPINSTGLEIELYSSEYTSSRIYYDILINESLLETSPGGLVDSFRSADSSLTGSVTFCIRVSTWEELVPIEHRDTKFDIYFDLTESAMIVFDNSLSEDNADFFETYLDSSCGVNLCQCDSTYSCYTTPSIIEKDDNIELCLYPTMDEDLEVNFHISNFNLQLSAGSLSFDAVLFGSDNWVPNILTSVSESGNTIRVVTPVVAQFFAEGFDRIEVNGNAFIEVESRTKLDISTFNNFHLEAELAKKNTAGCLSGIFEKMSFLYFYRIII